MNKSKRNIVYVDDGNGESYYKKSLKLYDIREKRGYWNNIENHRFPYLVKVNSLKDIKRKQGFLLVLTMDDLYYEYKNIVDVFVPDVYEIDRYVRKRFRNFKYVIIISIEKFDYGHIPFSNIYVEYANKYFDTNEGLNILINKLYKEYLESKEKNFSKQKMIKIEKLKSYLKGTRKKFITTKQIMNDLNVTEKWIQRYMKDMNYLYNNVGYNKKKRIWYVVNNKYKN